MRPQKVRVCQTTAKLIQQFADDVYIAIDLEKIEDINQIMSYGVMSTPGMVIEGAVVHACGVPHRKQIQEWLS